MAVKKDKVRAAEEDIEEEDIEEEDDEAAAKKKKEEDEEAERNANAGRTILVRKDQSKRAQHIAREIFRRRTPVSEDGRAPKSLDADTREVDMIISTGMAVRRCDWWDDFEYDEVLDMSPKSIRMSRLQEGAPLLDSHNWYAGIEAQLGCVVPGTARVDGKELLARARFSQDDPLAQRVFNDIKNGIRIALSAGYRVHAFKEDRTTTPPTRTITDWEPVEVSLVAIPAEHTGTGFRSAPITNRGGPTRREATKPKERAMLKLRREPSESDADLKARIMNELKAKHPVENESAEELAKRAEAAFADIRAAELEVERTNREKREQDEAIDAAIKRREERRARGLDPDDPDADEAPAASLKDYLAIGRQAGMNIDEVEKLVKPKMTVEQFRAVAFDFLTKKQKGTEISTTVDTQRNDGGITFTGSIRMGENLGSGRADAMTEALVCRTLAAARQPAIITQAQLEWCRSREIVDQVGLAMRIVDGKEKPRNPQTREFLGCSLLEIAAVCANYPIRGMLRPGMAEDILRRAFHATSDFPAIFENVLNKSLLARYTVAMPTYREIAIERTFNDFRPHPQVRAGDYPQPKEISETGEIKYGTASDSKETVSVKPYGVAFSISRHMMVNDDLSGIDQILGSTGQSVLRFENTTFFTMLLTPAVGPNLINANSPRPVYVFGAVGTAGSNYTGSANTPAAPSIQSISLGRQYLRGMKTLDGQFLNVNPTIILTGPVQETVAEQMVTQITPALTGSVNPFQSRLRPVTEASIPGTAWYLFANPGELPCFVYGFLAGAGGPRIRTDEPFGVQGVRVSLEHDFGVGAIDYRGTYQNYGA
jgi:hypothetical protein